MESYAGCSLIKSSEFNTTILTNNEPVGKVSIKMLDIDVDDRKRAPGTNPVHVKIEIRTTNKAYASPNFPPAGFPAKVDHKLKSRSITGRSDALSMVLAIDCKRNIA
jgi:hypothetical protein